jgi:hypothetical protein
MSGDSSTENSRQKPHYCASTDLFQWHQYQGQDTNDCAAYCIAIAGNALFNRAEFDGAEVAREMERILLVPSPIPHLTLHKIPGWAALPWGVAGYMQSKKIPSRLRWFASVEALIRNLQDNRTTIVILGDLLRGWAHAKVLYGYEPTGPSPQRGFYFVDPGYPREWSRLYHPQGVFWQDAAEFKQQWNNLFRIAIELRP